MRRATAATLSEALRAPAAGRSPVHRNTASASKELSAALCTEANGMLSPIAEGSESSVGRLVSWEAGGVVLVSALTVAVGSVQAPRRLLLWLLPEEPCNRSRFRLGSQHPQFHSLWWWASLASTCKQVQQRSAAKRAPAAR